MSDVANVIQIKTHKFQLIFNSQNINKLSAFNKQTIKKRKRKLQPIFSLMLRNAFISGCSIF